MNMKTLRSIIAFAFVACALSANAFAQDVPAVGKETIRTGGAGRGGVEAPGAVVVASLQDKGGQAYNVVAYGANPNDTTDDTAAIVAAISAAPAYGEIVFPAPARPSGYYKVSSTITLSKPLILKGLGGMYAGDMDNNPALGPPYYNVSPTRTAGVKWLWAGGASEVLKVYDTEGVRIENLIVDGAGVATYALMFDTVRHSRVAQSAFVRAATAAFIIGTSTRAVGGNNNNGSRFNVFDNVLFYSPNGVQIKKIGAGGSGGYHNKFYSCRILFEGADGVGLHVVNGDNNSFYSLFSWIYSGASTKAVQIGTSMTPGSGAFDPQGAYNSYFYHLQALGVWVYNDSPVAGIIYGLDQANTANLPVIGTNSRLTYWVTGHSSSSVIAAGGARNGLVMDGSIHTSSHINSGGVVTMSGGMASGTVTLTTSATITPSDATLYLVGAGAGALNITLPPPAGWSGYELTIKKTDGTANAVTILGTIDGAASYTLTAFAQCVRLKAHGSSGNWFVVGKC